MTAMTDPMVADVCRRVGFSGDHLRTAIATALATSGGVAAYDHPIWPGPVAHYRGLWGLDTVAHPDYADVEMENPYAAAHVARELVGSDGDWSWCPAWRAGAHHHYGDRARAAAGRLPHRETMITPNTIDMDEQVIHQAGDHLAAFVDAITRHPIGG